MVLLHQTGMGCGIARPVLATMRHGEASAICKALDAELMWGTAGQVVLTISQNGDTYRATVQGAVR